MVESIEVVVARIDERVAGIVKTLDGRGERLNDHGRRLASLETTRTSQKTVAKAGAIVVTAAGTLLGWLGLQ